MAITSLAFGPGRVAYLRARVDQFKEHLERAEIRLRSLDAKERAVLRVVPNELDVRKVCAN